MPAESRESAFSNEIFELAPVGYLVLDATERIRRANRTLLEWVDARHEQLEGQYWADVVLSVAGRVLVETHIRPLLTMQQTAHRIALDLKSTSGQRIPVLATIVQRRDEQGQPNGYLVTFVEAIDRENYERELLEAKHAAERAADELRELAADLEQRVARRTAQLEIANLELDRFAHAVSHDLRAPVRSIRGFTQALGEDYAKELGDPGRKLLNAIDGAARNMSDLIEGLLQLALTSRGEMHMQLCNLSEIAEHVRDELMEEGEHRDVEWLIEPSLTAWADPRMMQALLRNLLGNAWKYTSKKPGARIEFTGDRNESECTFRVKDNGAGFDMARASRLFEPFQRMHAPGEFPGLGIGLATVQRIVQRHGGRISAESAPNMGATFQFSLPGRHIDPGL